MVAVDEARLARARAVVGAAPAEAAGLAAGLRGVVELVTSGLRATPVVPEAVRVAAGGFAAVFDAGLAVVDAVALAPDAGADASAAASVLEGMIVAGPGVGVSSLLAALVSRVCVSAMSRRAGQRSCGRSRGRRTRTSGMRRRVVDEVKRATATSLDRERCAAVQEECPRGRRPD